MARKRQKSKPKTAGKRRAEAKSPKDALPLNNVIPPLEHRFQAGNPGGPGRPRKLSELKELILTTLAEETHDAEGRRLGLTRAQMLIRTMLIKSPSDRIALLEYAFGKMPQAFQHSGPDGGQIQFAQLSERELDDLLAGLFAQVAARAEGAGGAVTRGEGAAGGGAGTHGEKPP